MELYDMLHPMLELSISIPAIILCFLPMKNHLNGKGKLLLLWGIPTLILWCGRAGSAGGFVIAQSSVCF